MAKQQEDAFDVLTFYIYVMALLTVIVAGFALVNKKKVDAEAQKIKAELIKLDLMKKLALDEDLRGWIARERESRVTEGGGAPADFQALYVKRAEESRVRLTTHSSQGTRNLPGGTELSYRLQLDGCRVEDLVRFLVRVEEDWPGARVKGIAKLDWNTRNELWDAVVELSIFRAAST
ncbi:MAG: hypothetical protein KF878_34420 [Planctomycetes bacterium]|nr:hypothetical protein [Planctomycetota bacterium]